MKNSLYISDKRELSRVLTWVGVIIFWLTFWLPRGIFLGGQATSLGAYFPEMEVIIPVSAVGILIVLGAQFFQKHSDREYLAKFWHGGKTVALWLVIMTIISFFSRDFGLSVLFIPIFLLGMLTIPVNKELFPDSLYKNSLLVAGVLTGILVSQIDPDLKISRDLLALVSVLGLTFLSDQKTIFNGWKSAKSREFFAKLAMQAVYFYAIFQSDNLIFLLLALIILFFSQKVFIYRRGHLSPDIWGIFIFAGFFITRLSQREIYKINLPTTIPHFWSNFREILLGVGQGQFLPALQQNSDFLLPLTKLQIPNNGFLLTLFEQGVLGVFAILLLFVFSYYLHHKRSKLYILIIFLLWFFSREFMASENGLILFLLFLFLNVDWKISRDFTQKIKV